MLYAYIEKNRNGNGSFMSRGLILDLLNGNRMYGVWEAGEHENGGVSKRRILFFYKQSPDFHKPGLCHVQKILYL